MRVRNILEKCRHLFNKIVYGRLNISELFQLMSGYSYAIIKVDSPYMPVQFPKRIAYGHDLDIYIYKQDLIGLTAVIDNWCKRRGFIVKSSDKKFGRMISILPIWGGTLLDIDLAYSETLTKRGFVEECLQKGLVDKGKYKALCNEYEYIVRYVNYIQNNNKTHHRAWMEKHQEDKDEVLLELFIPNYYDMNNSIKQLE